MTRLYWIATALAVCPAAAAAQTAPDAEKPKPPFAGTVVTSGPAGSTDSATRLGDIDFNLEIGEDTSEASAQIGGYRVTNRVNDANPSGRQTAEIWTVKLAVPIGGTDDLTTASTLDTLSNGSELSFTYSWTWSRGANLDAPGYPELFLPGGDVREGCVAASRDAGVLVGDVVVANRSRSDDAIRDLAGKAAAKLDPAAPKTVVKAALDAALSAPRNDPEAIRKAAREAAANDAVRPSAAAPAVDTGACAPPGPAGTVFAKRYAGRPDSEINRMVFSPTYRLGIVGGIGVNRFDYVDSATLTKLNPSKPQFRGGISGSIYFAGGTSALLGSVEYHNGFKAVDEGLVCKPVVTDPETDCVTGRPSPAVHIERVNVSVEYRHIFETGWKAGDFAISPKATYDTLSDEFVGVFPVYFVPAKAGPFSPGASISYSSKTDQVSFGLFMRTSFTF